MFLFPDSAMPGNGWRKSTFSGQDGNCVEVGNGHGHVLVRDTNDRGGPALPVTAAAWRLFVTALKAG